MNGVYYLRGFIMVSRRGSSEQPIENQGVPVAAFPALSPQEWPLQWHPTNIFPTPQSVQNEFQRITDREISFSPSQHHYRLGEPYLPVSAYREYIVDTVRDNPVTVICSETGSGKSTQLGLELIEAGARRVLVSQPRIIASRELFERGKYNFGPEYEHIVGYSTGNDEDSDLPDDAQLVYITEDKLFKMINRGGIRPDDVIINDEAHEKTAGTIALLGLLKTEVLPSNPNMRLIISSATIDTSIFSRYFDDAPVMILPGRTYPVTRKESDKDVASVMREYMLEGKNVLAFESGIGRLRKTAHNGSSHTKSHTIHPLYGDQSPREQKLALDPRDKHHIVSTRIGETSLTPPNKQVVVDSGLTNYGIYRAGVNVLSTDWSSQATMEQRAGRVGRTGPGIYVIATPGQAPPRPDFKDRPEYDPPAMENSSVTSYILELLREGRRFENLDLLEKPTYENLVHDYTVLQRLGALAMGGEQLEITRIGRDLTDLPLDVTYGRMLIEPRSFYPNDPAASEELRLQVAATVAIQQVNGILDGGRDSARRYLIPAPGQKALSNETESDTLFELDVITWLMSQEAQILSDGKPNAEARVDSLLIQHDILPNRYYKAGRTFREICRREGLQPEYLTKPSTQNRALVKACQIVATPELFVHKGKQVYGDIRDERRMLSKRSTISTMAHLVIGRSFDLEEMRTSGISLRRFVVGGSVVTAQELLRYAPQRVSRQSIGICVQSGGKFVEHQALYFDGTLRFAHTTAEVPATHATREAIIRAMMTGEAHSASRPYEKVEYASGTVNAERAVGQWRHARELQHKTDVKLNVDVRMESVIRKAVQDSEKEVSLDVTNPALLDAYIPKVYQSSLVKPTRKSDVPEILRSAPDGISLSAFEGQKSEWVEVRYRDNLAFVTIPRNMQFSIRREDFADLAKHGVKLRIASGRFGSLEDVFMMLDKGRAEAETKWQRRHKTQNGTGLAVNPDVYVPATSQGRFNSGSAANHSRHTTTEGSKRFWQRSRKGR